MRLIGELRTPTAVTATALVALTASLTGCSLTDKVRGCTAADTALVNELSSVTRTGIPRRGAMDIDRVEVGKTVTIDLPEDLHEFGADRLLATRASVYGADPPSPDFPGIEIDAFVAVSSDGELIAPLSKVTELTFDIDGPDDPSWRDWAAEVKASSEADEARSCVDPDA